MPDYFCDRFHPVQCSKTCFIHNYFRKLQFKWNLRLILCFNTQNSFLASKPHEKHLSSEIQNKEANIQILGQHVQGSKTWHFGFKWKTPLIWLWKMRVNFFFRDTHSLNNTQKVFHIVLFLSISIFNWCGLGLSVSKSTSQLNVPINSCWLTTFEFFDYWCLGCCWCFAFRNKFMRWTERFLSFRVDDTNWRSYKNFFQ